MTELTKAAAMRDVEAPIVEVLVMEDRAQITRRLELDLEAGRHRLRCAGVTPLIADRTLRCSAQPAAEAADARVLDVQVDREYIVRAARPEAEREITAAIEGLGDEWVDEHDQLRSLHTERHAVVAATARMAGNIGEQLVVGPFEPRWPELVAELDNRRAELEREALDRQWSQDDRRERLDRLLEERAVVLQPIGEYKGVLSTEVEVGASGRFVVEWQYLVACALWRPEYRAELAGQGDSAQVTWHSAGTVWQFTGEDWTGVKLTFSTARPTLGAELPLLSDDVLSAREKSDEEKKTIEVTSRDEVIAKTDSAPDAVKSDTPPGLDDGGEERNYTVGEPVDVPSDGRPHRLEFERWEASTETELRAVPERRMFVFLRSLQENRSNMPLLAGPVALTRDGGFVGRSEIAYVAPHERFALSWGSDDGLVVLRDVQRDYEQTGLRKQRHHTFDVHLYLANHSGEARRVCLQERLPVSEIEKVEIELDAKKTTGGFKKDEQGIVTWQLDLAAGAEKKVALAFEVRMPQNVRWDG